MEGTFDAHQQLFPKNRKRSEPKSKLDSSIKMFLLEERYRCDLLIAAAMAGQSSAEVVLLKPPNARFKASNAAPPNWSMLCSLIPTGSRN
jgi:hypothetical protein